MHCSLRCIGSIDEPLFISEAQILDSKCPIVKTEGYTSRMNCMMKNVYDICGTQIADQKHAGKNPKKIIQQNGGHHFRLCLYKFDFSRCFFPQAIRKNIKDIKLCRQEKTRQKAVKAIHLANRFLDMFNFRTNDREFDFGYEKDDTASMLVDQKLAIALTIDIKLKLRGRTTLTKTRKGTNGSPDTVSTKPYHYANTRNCRYLAAIMPALLRRGIKTNRKNTGMNEEAQGLSRQYGRHFTIKNNDQAMNTLTKKDTQWRAFVSCKGMAKRLVKAHQKSYKTIKAENLAGRGPMKILKDMKDQAKLFNEGSWKFENDFVQSVKYINNQDVLAFENGPGDVGLAGMIQGDGGNEDDIINGEGDNNDLADAAVLQAAVTDLLVEENFEADEGDVFGGGDTIGTNEEGEEEDGVF